MGVNGSVGRSLPSVRGGRVAGPASSTHMAKAKRGGLWSHSGLTSQRTGTHTPSVEEAADEAADESSEEPFDEGAGSERTRTTVATPRRSTPALPSASSSRGASSGWTTDCRAVPRYSAGFQPNHVVASGLISLKRHS